MLDLSLMQLVSFPDTLQEHGSHDQKTHGNKYGIHPDTGKRVLVYKGGSGGTKKGKSAKKSPASAIVAPMQAAAMQQSAQEMASLMDKNNTKETAVQSKIRIAKELAARLEGNQDFYALRQQMETMFHEPGMTIERACDLLIRNWAKTSGDHDELAVAMQQAAKNQFGLNDADMWFSPDTLNSASSQFGGVEPGMRAFLSAQYENTQSWFKSQGISEVTAYRGAGWYDGSSSMPQDISFDGTATKVSTSLQPLSSFSVEPQTALSFANSTGNNRLIIGASIPVSRILGSSQSGYGCKAETEMIVLGKKDTMLGYAWKSGSVSTGDIYNNLAAASQQ